MKKWIAIIVASIAVILVCFGVIFARQQKQSVTPTKNRSGLRIQKQKMSNSKKGMRNTDNITAQFSNDEWMLMATWLMRMITMCKAVTLKILLI